MKYYLSVMTAAGLLFGLIGTTSAQVGQGMGMGKGMGPGMHDQMAWRQGPQNGHPDMMIPGLTDEQKEKIRDLQTAHMKDVTALRSEIKINIARIDALMLEDEPDMNAIFKLIDETAPLRTEIRKKSVEQRLAVRALLTDEQKVFFDSRMGHPQRNFHAGNYRHGQMRPHGFWGSN